MEKNKYYDNVRFPVEIIKKAAGKLFKVAKLKPVDFSKTLKIEINNIKWEHTSEEEFFADYHQGGKNFHYRLWNKKDRALTLYQSFNNSISVNVEAPTRSEIESVFEVFEENLASARLPEEKVDATPIPSPTIFIGHGRDEQWMHLKDHLQDKHHFKISAYEIGARAGHAVRDVLEKMISESSLALLILTGEDKMVDGSLHARENVIHVF